MTYTPTMEQVRQAGVATYTYEQFDRWLNQVKAEAWDDAVCAARPIDEITVEFPPNPYRKDQR